MLAVEAAADDVFARFVGVGLGVRELREKGSADPPVACTVVDGGPEEVRGVDPLCAREATAFVAAVVAILGPGVPVRRELIRQAAGQFQLAFVLPCAMKALLLRRRAEI